jgi:hypothetical protein
VSALDKGWSNYLNGWYPIVVMRDAEGKETAVHCFQHVLKDRMMQIQPKVGDRLKITFGGVKATRDGLREVALYKVEAPDDTGANVWAQLGAQSANAAREGAPSVQTNEQEEIPF